MSESSMRLIPGDIDNSFSKAFIDERGAPGSSGATGVFGVVHGSASVGADTNDIVFLLIEAGRSEAPPQAPVTTALE